MVSLCIPGCSGTSSVESLALPLPHSARTKGMYHLTQYNYNFSKAEPILFFYNMPNIFWLKETGK